MASRSQKNQRFLARGGHTSLPDRRARENNRMRKTASPPLVDIKAFTVATGKSQRDFALFMNGLLPLFDLLSLPSAAFIAINIYSNWFVSAAFAQGRIDERYVMGALALLAPLFLYDKRFIAVASRGQMRALVRCYLT